MLFLFSKENSQEIFISMFTFVVMISIFLCAFIIVCKCVVHHLFLFCCWFCKAFYLLYLLLGRFSYSGSNGLNIVEAQHIFLIEPIVHPGICRSVVVGGGGGGGGVYLYTCVDAVQTPHLNLQQHTNNIVRCRITGYCSYTSHWANAIYNCASFCH